MFVIVCVGEELSSVRNESSDEISKNEALIRSGLKEKVCTIRESNSGLIDGNDQFYH